MNEKLNKLISTYKRAIEKEADFLDAYDMLDDFNIILQALREKAERDNKEPLTLVFGRGDIGVSPCRPFGEEKYNSVALWNPHCRGVVGGNIYVPDGTTTDDIDVYVQMFFESAKSAQVLVDVLNVVISDLGGESEIKESV